MHGEHLAQWLFHSMSSIPIPDMIIKARVRTSPQSPYCEISLSHHSSLIPFLRGCESHPGCEASASVNELEFWQEVSGHSTCQPLLTSLRKGKMCHTYGGPLLHIREVLCTNVWINLSWLWPPACYESVFQSQLSATEMAWGQGSSSLSASHPLLPLPPAVTCHHPESPRKPGWKRDMLSDGKDNCQGATLALQVLLTLLKDTPSHYCNIMGI